MSITAIVENDTIKLPVHVPDGTSVQITLPDVEAQASTGLRRSSRGFPIVPGRERISAEEVARVEAEA